MKMLQNENTFRKLKIVFWALLDIQAVAKAKIEFKYRANSLLIPVLGMFCRPSGVRVKTQSRQLFQ